MDRSYCSWARKLPATQSLVTTGMFLASGCSNTDDPDPANLASSPFCRNCVDISVQNTTDGPTVSPVNFTAYPPQPLLTSAELLEAVDAYLLDNSTFSDVFLKYGPIEFWDVGAISISGNYNERYVPWSRSVQRQHFIIQHVTCDRYELDLPGCTLVQWRHFSVEHIQCPNS
jgi:hypothetical protein